MKSMNKFNENETPFNGLFTITKNIIGDDRGYLERLYCTEELLSWGNRKVAQVNRTFTEKRGTIRGLHFQKPPFLEAKLICCLAGAVMDVALDLRLGSITFGQVFIIELEAEKHNAVLIPEGFAHGFQTLTPAVEMLYFHSEVYSSSHESGINVFDESLKINWQLPCTQISDRDKSFKIFGEFEGITI